MLAPGGMVTRTGAPPEALQAAAATIAVMHAPRTARAHLPHTGERMLKKYRRGERVDIALSTTGRPAHLANGPKGGRGGVPLVNQLDGEARPLGQGFGDGPDLDGSGRFVPVAVQRQAEDEAPGL
jgi:hypothetical protein